MISNQLLMLMQNLHRICCLFIAFTVIIRAQLLFGVSVSVLDA